MNKLAILNDILAHLDQSLKTMSVHEVGQARSKVAKLIKSEPQGQEEGVSTAEMLGLTDTKPLEPVKVEPTLTRKKSKKKRSKRSG